MKFETLAVVYMSLVLFGFFYNQLVMLASRRGWIQGYTSLFVVAGVLMTLAGVALVDWEAAVITVGAFTASGTPMILGSVWRHMRYREADIEAMRNEVRNDTAA
jgi:hypothetical protein